MSSLNPFSTPKQTATNNVPAWLTEAAQETFGRAKEVANKPYTPYTGQRVAPLSANISAASDAARNSTGGLFRNEYFQPAQDLIKRNPYTASAVSGRDVGTDQFTSDTLQRYMNPYIQGALNPVVRQLREGGQMDVNRVGATAAMRGAFGGSRQALLEAKAKDDAERRVSDALAQGYDRAFGQAGTLFTSDAERRLQADRANQNKDIDLGKFNETQRQNQSEMALKQAIGLGGLGSQFNQIKNDVVDRLLKTGGAEQQYGQLKADEDYSKFAESRDYDKNQLETLLNALSKVQGGAGTVTYKDSPNKLAEGLSGIGGLGSAFSTYGPLIGQGLGALGVGASGAGAGAGLMSLLAMSDVRSKRDIVKVGERDGVGIYEFSYKDKPGRFRGVMAQMVRGKHPDAVVEDDNGMLWVDYSKLPVPFEELGGLSARTIASRH